MTKSTESLEHSMREGLASLDIELKKTAKTHHIDLNHSENDFLAFIQANTQGWSLNRLNNLNEALGKVIELKQEENRKKQDVQTMQAKISNLAKQFKIPYEEVINMLNKNGTQN